jgi:hypothetical protein
MAEPGPAKKARLTDRERRTAHAVEHSAAAEDDAASAGRRPRQRGGAATGRVVARKREVYDERAAHWVVYDMVIDDVNSVRPGWKKMSMTEKGINDMSFEQMKRAATLFLERGGEVT